MDQDRRQFLKSGGILLSVAIGGSVLRLTPAAAREAGVPYQVLSALEVDTLEGLAESIVPGAREAGIAQFIDKQLAADFSDSLLMLKYLGVPEEGYLPFYQGGLASAAAFSQARYQKPWSQLSATEASALTADIAAGTPADWSGPPAGFFFFVIRSDGVDVVYGTEEGFAKIGVPYMPHIAPEQPW
ncbi:MAG: gluconate 2-dehydrogenase subunit 3 family protein [Pseudomonadota bacterium]